MEERQGWLWRRRVRVHTFLGANGRSWESEGLTVGPPAAVMGSTGLVGKRLCVPSDFMDMIL